MHLIVDCVCCIRLIRTRITVCSVCFHLLLYHSPTARATAIGVWSIKVYNVPICKVFVPAQVRMWISYTVCDTRNWIGLRVPSTVGCFHEQIGVGGVGLSSWCRFASVDLWNAVVCFQPPSLLIGNVLVPVMRLFECHLHCKVHWRVGRRLGSYRLISAQPLIGSTIREFCISSVLRVLEVLCCLYRHSFYQIDHSTNYGWRL